MIQLIDECSQNIEKIEERIERELPFRNAESFLAHSLLKLRQYKEEPSSGIVEAEYPKTQKERAKENLTKIVWLLFRRNGNRKNMFSKENSTRNNWKFMNLPPVIDLLVLKICFIIGVWM